VSTFNFDPARQIIPRWRFLSDRHVLPESAGDPRRPNRARLDPSYLEQKVRDWEEQRSLGIAADLFGEAMVTGEQDKALEVAKFILAEKEGVLPRVADRAQQFLASRAPRDSDETQRSLLLPPDAKSAARATVRRSRQRISRDARNMEAWLDLSRAYAVLGQGPLSERAMARALMVAPDHRLSLRAAARLYVHVHQPERALALVSKHPRTRTDPWLLATELALNSMLGRTSKLMRQARDLVESEHFAPSQLTELNGALSTVNFTSGSLRHARVHMRESLISPNDNAVAQARWVANQIGGVDVEAAARATANSYEARCWLSLQNAAWSSALSEAHAWLLDEPFSSRPAIQSSFIAISLMEEHALAAACARVGLVADPRNGTLLNNLTVALAYLGELQEAFQHYKEIPAEFSDDHPEFVHVATGALLRFRSGDITQGRELYQHAAEMAPAHRRWLVLAHWLKEELEFDPRKATTVTELCEVLLKIAKDPMAKRLTELVQGRAKQLLAVARNSELVMTKHDQGMSLGSISRIAKSTAIQDRTSLPLKRE